MTGRSGRRLVSLVRRCSRPSSEQVGAHALRLLVLIVVSPKPRSTCADGRGTGSNRRAYSPRCRLSESSLVTADPQRAGGDSPVDASPAPGAAARSPSRSRTPPPDRARTMFGTSPVVGCWVALGITAEPTRRPGDGHLTRRLSARVQSSIRRLAHAEIDGLPEALASLRSSSAGRDERARPRPRVRHDIGPTQCRRRMGTASPRAATQ